MNAAPNTYDLIVIGGGFAGLCAGARAAELGMRTLVLEKGDGEDYPCNSRQSGGILHIAFHDPFRPVDELSRIIERVTEGDARTDLVETTATNGRRLISWLQTNGTRFMRFNPQEGYRWCMAPPRALRAGMDWKDRGPDVVLRLLTKKIIRLGGEVSLRTRATSLIKEGSTCIGVRGEADGLEKDWLATHTLIADGGFQSDRILFSEHIGPGFDTVFQRGARTGVGDGLRMAVAAGAATTGTNRFYGHLLCAEAISNDRLWPYPDLDAIATAGLVVDESGCRVADEGKGGVYLTNRLAALPERSGFFAVFDDAIWRSQGTSARIPANPLLEQAGGTVLRADTIDGLAAMTNVPAAALRQTIAAHNAALHEGRLDRLSIARSKEVKAHPIMLPPFMAISIIPGITYTMGGIAIDGQAQVLDEKGVPIPGLLAAGATTGGLEGGEGAAYVGGLLKAGVFGLVAAERAAALQNRPVPSEPSGAPGVGIGYRGGNRARLPQGLDRFPVLRATLRFGKAAGILFGLVVAAFILLVGWAPFDILAIPLAAFLGMGATALILGYTELIRLIVELLIPD